ncbi:MAG: 4Fe-4S binding protein [Candidatus Aenigmatarchaeota archaeon]
MNPRIHVTIALLFFVILISLIFLLQGTIESYSKLLRQVAIIIGLVFVASLFALRESPEKKNRNLLEIGIINRFVRWKYYKLFLQIPTLLIFLVVLFFGFFGPVNSALNVNTILTWTIWWAAVIFTFVLAGRLWCTACPFGFLGDISQKVFSLRKKFPRRENGLKIQMPLFLIFTLSFVFFGVLSSPIYTSYFIIVLSVAAVGFALIFEKRAFCRYICPIGAVTGLYSMVSPIELRSKDCDTCKSHLKKNCFESCSMGEYIGNMKSNYNCNFCMDCVKACPKNNIVLRFRNFGSDLWSTNMGIAGSIAALLIIGVSIIQTVAMMGPWPAFQNTIASVSGIFNPSIVYLLSFFLIVIGLPLGAYAIFVFMSNKLSGTKESFAKTFSVYGLMFMPLGIAIHLAHNVAHLLVEGFQIIPAAAFSFGATTHKLIAVSPVQNETVFWIQSFILFAGYFLSLLIGHKLSLRYGEKRFRTFIPMIVFTIIIMLVGLYIFGLPMNAAHTH